MGWILTGFALVALIDLPPLLKRRDKRAVAAFLFLFGVALTLAVLQSLDVEVPSMMLLFDRMYKSIGLAYVAQ